MIDERTEELASLYAFDLLEDAERTAFEAQLASDPALQLLVRDLREAAAALAFSAPSPSLSPSLKARVLARIASTSSMSPASNLRSFRLPAFIPWAVAASFAIGSLWLGQRLISVREEARSEAFALRTEARLTDIARREAENRLAAERLILNRQITDTTRQLAEATRQLTSTGGQLAATTLRINHLNQRLADLGQQLRAQGDLAQFKIATLSSMLDNSPQALAVAVWNPAKQEGIFTVDKLPPAETNHDYELWVIDPHQAKPVSGGVFAVGADGQARIQFKTEAPVVSIAKFAVSREKKGGAPRLGGPQGKVIMISQ